MDTEKKKKIAYTFFRVYRSDERTNDETRTTTRLIYTMQQYTHRTPIWFILPVDDPYI